MDKFYTVEKKNKNKRWIESQGQDSKIERIWVLKKILTNGNRNYELCKKM